jgi:DnaJ-domain-containing protein 1
VASTGGDLELAFAKADIITGDELTRIDAPRSGMTELELRHLKRVGNISIRAGIDSVGAARTVRDHMRISERIRVVKMLVEQATADDPVSPNKCALVRQMGRELGISSVTLSRMLADSVRERFAAPAPDPTEHTRRAQYYAALGVADSASSEEIRRAFRQLAKELHPDRHMHAPPHVQRRAEKQFQRISEAYHALVCEEAAHP